jgi:hypothetical protein
MKLSYFQKINNSYNTSSSQESDLYDIKQEINDGFEDTIDYHSVLKRDNTKQDLLIIHEKSSNKKSIKSRPNEIIKDGECYIWNNCNWLVTEVDTDSQLYTSAVMDKCNYILPFQLNSPTIYNEPCIVEDNQTTIGENQNTIITVPDTVKHILIQYNENTSKIEKGKRIFVDKVCASPSVYKITKIDRIKYMDGENGLLKLTCDESSITDGDRPDLLIANYVSTTIPTNGTCLITYSGSADIKIGMTKVLTAVFKDGLGNILTDITPIWTVTKPVGYESYITYKTSGMTLTLTAVNKSTMIGQTVNVKLSNSDGTENYSLDIKVVSLF